MRGGGAMIAELPHTDLNSRLICFCPCNVFYKGLLKSALI